MSESAPPTERPEAERDGEERPPTQVATPSETLDVGIGLGGAVAFGLTVVLVGTALAIVYRPSLVADVDAAFLLVGGTGVLAAALGGRSIYRHLRADPEQADPPLVESRSTTTVPGEDLDTSLVGDTTDVSMSGFRQRRAVSRRLRSLVVSTLTYAGWTDAEAEAAVDDGTWTDDPGAAARFRIESSLSRADRLRLRLRGIDRFEWESRHVIDAVARRLELTDREWTDPEERGDVGAAADGWVGAIPDLQSIDRELDRWTVAAGLALLSLGLGAVVREPGLVLAATVGTGLAAYGYAGSTPAPRLAVRREIADTTPDPGETVAVTVTVENVGENALFDLRLIDGVPAGLGVEDGSPRHGSVLQPGATAQFRYTVRADRGSHRFDDLAVIARNASGALERTATVDVAGDDRLTCSPHPTERLEVPVHPKTTRDVGRVVTDTGGSGIEFHSVREYRHGDPLKRIDWNRAARGDGLATLQFNVERSTTVVLLVDARTEAFVAADRDAPSAVERSLGAVSEVFVGLLDSDDRVGLGTIGPDSTWLSPGAGAGHWAMARDMLTDTDQFTRPDPDTPFHPPIELRKLRKELPQDAQIVLFSPLCDDIAVEMTRRLHAYGYPTTVVSPDTTGTESPGRTAAHLERRLRLSRLRRAGVRVIDWGADERLAAATDRAARRWSR